MAAAGGHDEFGGGEQSTAERRAAVRWFVGSLIFAVALSFLLFHIDESLTHSSSERELGATLRELRSAQSGLRAQPVDDRLQ